MLCVSVKCFSAGNLNTPTTNNTSHCHHHHHDRWLHHCSLNLVAPIWSPLLRHHWQTKADCQNDCSLTQSEPYRTETYCTACDLPGGSQAVREALVNLRRTTPQAPEEGWQPLRRDCDAQGAPWFDSLSRKVSQTPTQNLAFGLLPAEVPLCFADLLKR